MVTTQTTKVVYGDEDDTSVNNYHMNRKLELREFKLLQKQEQKQFQDLTFKAHVAAEAQVSPFFFIQILIPWEYFHISISTFQEKKFEQEKFNLVRAFEAEMENKARVQKQQVEKTEQMQESELRQLSKRIRSEQV